MTFIQLLYTQIVLQLKSVIFVSGKQHLWKKNLHQNEDRVYKSLLPFLWRGYRKDNLSVYFVVPEARMQLMKVSIWLSHLDSSA